MYIFKVYLHIKYYKNILILKHLLNVCLDPGFQTLDYHCCYCPLGLQCPGTSEGPLSLAVF